MVEIIDPGDCLGPEMLYRTAASEYRKTGARNMKGGKGTYGAHPHTPLMLQHLTVQTQHTKAWDVVLLVAHDKCPSEAKMQLMNTLPITPSARCPHASTDATTGEQE